MTRGRKLGVLLLALAALLVLTIVVMELAPDGKGTEEATAVTIFTLDPDQVTSLTWQYEEETISLEKDQENNWTYPADAAFPLDWSTWWLRRWPTTSGDTLNCMSPCAQAARASCWRC